MLCWLFIITYSDMCYLKKIYISGCLSILWLTLSFCRTDGAHVPCSRHVRFHEEEEIVRINPRERSWLTGYEDYRHATTATRAKPLRPDSTDAYVHLAKSEPPKHDYTYAYPLSGDGHTPRDGKTGIGGGVVNRSATAAHRQMAATACGGQQRALTVCVLSEHVQSGRKQTRGAARKLQTPCRRAFAGWASCGARTACSTIACRTPRATIQTLAPATPAKSASACAGWRSWDCRC